MASGNSTICTTLTSCFKRVCRSMGNVKGHPCARLTRFNAVAKGCQFVAVLLDSSNITQYFVALKSKKWEMERFQNGSI